MRKIILFLSFAFLANTVFSQVRSNNLISGSIGNQSAFIDASATAFSNSLNNGKGLVFPRTNLTTFQFASDGNFISFSSRYDGMIIYNTATGVTPATNSGIGGQNVIPGFYYFSNPTSATINGGAGQWLPLTPLVTDDQLLSIVGDSLRIEDGNAIALDSLGTDDQLLFVDGDSLRLEDGAAVALTDLGSDDQRIIGSVLSGSDLTIGIEDGVSENVSLIGLASDSAFVTTLASDSIFVTTLVNDSAFVTSLATDSLFNTTLAMDTNFIANLDSLIGSDDQRIIGSVLSGSDLTIGIEDGASEDVSLIGLASDSAFVTTLASDSIFVTTLVNDSTFVTSLATDSLFNTTLAMDTNFIANLDSLIGSDDQRIIGSVLSGSDLTIGIEDGASEDVSLIGLASDSAFVTTLASDSIFVTTLVNDSTFVTSLATDSLFNTTLAMDTNFIANLDSLIGSDDQRIIGSVLSGSDLTIGIEDGASEDVSLIGLASDSAFVTTLASDSIFVTTLVNDSTFVTSLATDSLFNTTLAMDTNFIANLDSLIGSDDQALSIDGDSLRIEDGNAVALSGLGTDNQNIESLALNNTTNVLTVGIEDGTSGTVDLSSLLDNTDDQTLNIDGDSLRLEDGGAVALSGLGTDNQNIESLALNNTTNVLTVGIEDGTSGTVDLSSLLDNTDDQVLSIDGDSLRLEDGGAVALNSFELIDDDGDTQIQVEESADDDIIRFDAGGVELATFSSSQATFGNPQTIDNQVILTPANSSGFEAYNASNFSIYNMTSSHAGSILFNNAFEIVGASYHGVRDVAGTDWGLGYVFDNSYVFSSIRLRSRGDCCGARVGGGQIRIYNAGELVATSSIINSSGNGQWTAAYIPNVVGDEVRYILPDGVNTQGGGSVFNFTEFEISGSQSSTVDLTVNGNARITGQIFDSGNSAGTDGQVLSATANGTDWVTPTITVNTDDQALSIDGDSLRLEDGGAVALSGLGTDNQNIESLALNNTTNVLTVGIEDGTSGTVDLSSLLDNTDDQTLNIDGDSLRLEDGGAVALSGLGTDNQNIESLALNNTTNVLTVGIEDGASGTVDLSSLRDADGDAWGVNGEDQTTSISRTGNVGIGSTPITRLTVGPVINGTSSAYDEDALVISTDRLPGSSTVLNDPIPLLQLIRAGTSGVNWPSRANFSLSRFAHAGANANSRLDLQLASTNFENQTNVMTWLSNGNVGVGATSPSEKLTVQSGNIFVNNDVIGVRQPNISSTGVVDLNTVQEDLILTRYHSSNHQGFGYVSSLIDFRTDNGTEQWTSAQVFALTDAGSGNYSGGLAFAINPGGADDPDGSGFRSRGGDPVVRMLIQANGDVGIGVLNPSQKLHVNGNARITGQIFDSGNNAGTAGQVLSATANGTDWVTPNAAVNTDDQALSIDGDSLRLEDGGAVALNSFELIDDDGDTQIQVEESADDDIIRFDAGGVELATFSSSQATFGKPQTGVSQEILTSANPSGFEAYNASNFSTYNMTSSYAGSTLFNNFYESAGASYHGVRDVAGTDWGLGYSFDNPYSFTSIRLRSRGDCCGARVGGGQIRIYNAGELVATSSIINSPGNGQWTAAYIPNVVGDEVRYILPNGVNTQQGDQTLNFVEFEISGSLSNSVDLTVNGNASIRGQIFDSGNSSGTAGQVLSATANGTDWIDAGASSPGKVILSAEYAGAVLNSDGTNNRLEMTSNNIGAPSYMNYYEARNSITNGSVEDYDVVVRITIPEGFAGWDANAIQLASSGTSNASYQISIFNTSGTALVTSSVVNGTGTGTNFSNPTIATNTNLSSLNAGDTFIIAIKLRVTGVVTLGNSLIRIGDITLNYQ